MRTYTDIARRLGLDEKTVRAVAEELEICGYRVAKPEKFTKWHIRMVRQRFDAGESVKSIADSTGIMFSAVYGIAHRKTWREVTDKPGPMTRRC
ncbi:MAG: hypothetical protein OEX14_03965 [Paracoccaceae bacterium]|nr:hypothetical protein [Paracoccaceae bacterium]